MVTETAWVYRFSHITEAQDFDRILQYAYRCCLLQEILVHEERVEHVRLVFEIMSPQPLPHQRLHYV